MISEPIGVQLKRTKGWRMPENTVKVARGRYSKWGNSHKVGPDCDAATAVARFEDDLVCERLTDKNGVPLLHQLGELKGKNLACFCRVGEPCHRDVLLRLANAGS